MEYQSDEARISRIMTWIAGTLALLITVVIPSSYFFINKQAMQNEMDIAARLHATFVTQAVMSNESDWQTSIHGLIQTELTPIVAFENRAVVTNAGQIVDQNGPNMASGLLMTASADVLGVNGRVGQVLITRSLNRTILDSVVVAIFSCCFGLTMFISLRVLPLNALRKTMHKLEQTEGLARRAAEENFQVVFKNALDGIMILKPDGQVLMLNDSAGHLLDIDPKSTSQINVKDLINFEQFSADSKIIHPGHFESVATTPSGNKIPVEVSVSESHGGEENQRILILRDITERKNAQTRLQRLANYDSLTGLPNRSKFRECLAEIVDRRHTVASQGRVNALMFLDLDRFKNINDSLGHEIGDQLLLQVADVISLCVRQTDFLIRNQLTQEELGVFRLGGDEFTVLLEGLPNQDVVETIAQRINLALCQPFQVHEHQLFISGSIGIAMYGAGEIDIDSLIKQADLAMYRSKALGKDTYTFYSSELQETVATLHNNETALRQALERQEFGLVYQPKANLETGKITGVEALLRWHRADGITIMPDAFIPILEETGLIIPVGFWVIQEACETVIRWDHDGIGGLTVAVNLSARQFRQKDLVEQIEVILKNTGLPAARLEVELTESALFEDTQSVLEIMHKLAALGVSVAVDDFGTGHSSLRYLKRFDVDTLKIDRSFIRDIPSSNEDVRIASAIISLARNMGIKVVAEGVETAEQLTFLRNEGCEEMQGYLLSRPISSVDFIQWMRSENHELVERTL
jgi:diguanylate cyclase